MIRYAIFITLRNGIGCYLVHVRNGYVLTATDDVKKAYWFLCREDADFYLSLLKICPHDKNVSSFKVVEVNINLDNI